MTFKSEIYAVDDLTILAQIDHNLYDFIIDEISNQIAPILYDVMPLP